MTTETKPDLHSFQEAIKIFQQALQVATDNGTFDELAADIHPDRINAMCDTVDEIARLDFGPRKPYEDLIDLTHSAASHGLYARYLWEKLFRYVRPERFKTLHDFACDLNCFKEMFEKGKDFWWVYDPDTGFTDIRGYNNPFEHRFLIRLYDTDNGRRYISIQEFFPQTLDDDENGSDTKGS